MSEKLSATIEVGLDGSKVQDGVAPIARTLDNLGKVAKKAGQDSADGIAAIGESSTTSASKVDRATGNMIGSIQRTTAAMESGSKTSAKYFELLASQRGISADVLKPYLEQLKAVEAAQKTVGISAAQTAAAMRSVPAQFTDIITSLQGGQKPLTVLLQQGGQLKDMFGGAGNAAKALGTYVVGLVNPLTLTAAAVGGLAYVYSQANNEAKEFSKSIIISGNAAGVTTDQLMDSAKRMSDLGISSQSLAAEALNGLVATGNVSIGLLDQTAQSAIKAQKLLGIAVEDTIKAFSDLGKSPTKTVESLNDKYHFLTLEIYEQIKAFEDQGKKANAARLAQSTYADAITSQSEKVKSTLTDWERGWLRIKNATSGAFSSVMTMFADPTSEQKIATLFKEREKLEQSQKKLSGDNSFINAGAADRVQQLLDANKAEINAIRDKIKAKNDDAIAEENKNKQVQAGIEWGALKEKNLSKEAKLELEITKARNLGIAAGKSQTEIEKEIATIRENNKEKTKKIIEDQSLAWQVHKATVAAAGKAEKAVMEDIQKSLLAIKMPNSLKQINDEFEKQNATFLKLNSSLDEYAISLQGQNELAELERSLIGASATERGILIEQYKIELALQKEIRKIKSEIKDAGSAQVLIDKANSNAEIEKSQAVLKIQQQEWTKFYDDIYNGLSDSLYRGFEAGKGFFQSFWDGIKNLFKTTVLKLAVQGVMTGILGAGFAGVANASPSTSAFGGAGNLISVGKSIYDGFSLAAGAGAGVTAIGNLLGSSAISAFGAGMGLSSSAAAGAAGAYSAAGMGTTASAITAGSTVGMVLPYLAAAAVLYKGLSMGDKQLGGQTVSGTLGTSDLMRNQSWTQSGGFLRGDRSGVWSYGLKDSTAIQDGKSYVDTANIANDQALLKAINDGYAALKNASTDYAKTLGLNADLIANRTDAINFSLGKTDAERQANLTAAFTGVGNAIADDLLGNLVSLKKAGEDSGTELARLAQTFKVTNDFLSVLGKNAIDVFGGLSASSLEARQRLIDLVGGVDNLNSSAAFFAQNFLSEGERLAPSIKAVSEQMDLLGLASVTTVEQFKQTVQGIDYSTEAGAKMYATLMNIAPAFKLVADYSEKAAAQVIADAQAKADAEIKAQQAAQKAAEDMARQVADQAAEEAKRIADAQSAARATLEAAYNAEAQGIENVIGKLKSFSTSIRSFLESLAINNSTLSPEEAFKEAQRQYADTLSRASNGDDAAQQALTGKAQAYNEAIKNYFGSSKAGADALDAMKNELGAIAEQTDAQLVAAERQMNILKSQVAQLINIDKSVGSVTDAIKALQEALKPTVKSAPKAELAYDEHLYGLNPDGTRRQMAGETAAEFIASMIPGFQRSLVQSWYAANPNASAPDRNSIDYWVDQIAKLGQLGAEDAFNTAVAKLTNTEQVNKPLVWSTFQNQGTTDNTEVLNKISEHLEALVVVQQTANPEIIDTMVEVSAAVEKTRKAAAMEAAA